jgi:outer membrane protein OmpA-like peptidoglycan-associated protein
MLLPDRLGPLPRAARQKTEPTMKHLASTLAVALGLALTSCGGAKKPAADASSASDDDSTEREESSGGSDESKDSSESSKSSDSSDSSDSSGSSDSDEPDSSSSGASSKANVEQEDEKSSGDCQKSTAKLAISLDRNSINLDKGTLRAKMDGPICSIKMKITRKDGAPPVEKSFRYNGSERELRWDPVPRDEIEKVEIRITAQDNGFQAVNIVPWSVTIDHKEVEFDTNKALIRPTEAASLQDSLTKIKSVLSKVEGKGLGTITLFIAGHTDTQGSDEHNMTLSRNRAQAIASWFMKNGLCVPIAFEGFGETALKKVTPDNTDEQANRRVDYILAVEPPSMSRKGATPAWKWISKGC